MKQEQGLQIVLSLVLSLGSLAFGVNAPRARAAPDNSALNERDRSSTELTADQQGSAKDDVEIARLIRRNIMSHRELSSYAHNVKIIANNGFVTLKGPVRSQKEMNIIEGVAGSACGSAKVTNEMQIANRE